MNNATNSQIVKLNKLNSGSNSDLDYGLVDSGAYISVASYSLAKRLNCRIFKTNNVCVVEMANSEEETLFDY